jgi:hypothetical protein
VEDKFSRMNRYVMSNLLLTTFYVLALLSLASWIDLKIGKIPNLIWLGFIPASRFLSLLTLRWAEDTCIPQLVVSVLATVSLALLFFELGFFGGADMKAVISVSHIFPLQVNPILSSTSAPVWVPLSMLVNASLASTVYSFTIRVHQGPSRNAGEKTCFLPFLALGFIVAMVIGDPFTIVVNLSLGIR